MYRIKQVVPRKKTGYKFESDASYLLAGGFGGLGRCLARHMVKHGARNLIFVSRSGTSRTESQALVDELKAAGTNVRVLACDIVDENKLQSALSAVLAELPPIRGVIQASMVLEVGSQTPSL